MPGLDTDPIVVIPSANASFLSDLQTFLREEAPDVFTEQGFVGFVVSGGLHGTAASLTSSAFATIAYPGGFRISQPAAAIVYANNATTWVIAHIDQSGNQGSFIRVGSTHYLTQVSATQPALPANALWLMQVTTAAGAITAVTDLRRRNLLPWVNVQAYGAKGDGVTDDTAAIRLAMLAGTRVYFPAGTYLITGTSTIATDGLQLRAGHELFGDGPELSILKQASSSQYCLSANQSTGGTTSVTDNMTRLHLHDLQLLATVATDGFSEQKHLLNLNAVSDVLIERVKFKGFRGDGCYLGSGNVAGTERHNERVTFRKCTFDGVNNDNRNGISVIDCNGVLVQDCTFVNCTRSNMPGAIDMEPNTGVAYPVIKNIKILDNLFSACGGNFGTVSVALDGTQTYTTPPQHFEIAGNIFDNATGTGYAFTWAYTVGGGIGDGLAHDVSFHHNLIRNTTAAWFLRGVQGCALHHNTSYLCTTAALIGYSATSGYVKDVRMHHNLFQVCGYVGGSACAVFYANRVTMDQNTFIDCGVAASSAGIGLLFTTGTSDYVALTHNRFLAPTALLMVTAVSKAAGHTFLPQHNVCAGNDFGALNFQFQAYRTDAIPAAQVYLTANLPDDFPPGVSVAVLNGDAGAPDALKQGTLITHMYQSPLGTGYRKFAYQLYKPADNGGSTSADLWIRMASTAANTWDSWYLHSPLLVPVTVTYSASMNINAALGDVFQITATNNTAFQINNPTNALTGKQLTIRLRNTSGGALGAATWDTLYKLAAWTNPANNTSRSITFVYDGTNWIELNHTTIDVPV